MTFRAPAKSYSPAGAAPAFHLKKRKQPKNQQTKKFLSPSSQEEPSACGKNAIVPAPCHVEHQIRSLSDLKTLRKAIAAAAEREAERKRALAEAQRKAQQEQGLFRDAIGNVKALRGQSDRMWYTPEPPEPLPVQRLNSMKNACCANH